MPENQIEWSSYLSLQNFIRVVWTTINWFALKSAIWQNSVRTATLCSLKPLEQHNRICRTLWHNVWCTQIDRARVQPQLWTMSLVSFPGGLGFWGFLMTWCLGPQQRRWMCMLLCPSPRSLPFPVLHKQNRKNVNPPTPTALMGKSEILGDV